MKVLHLIVNFRTKLYLNLINGLDKYCESQFVYYPHMKGKNVDHILKNSKNSYHQSLILNIWTRIFYGYKLWVMYRDIKTNIHVSQFDVIHAHTLFSDGGLAYLLNRKLKIPYVLAIRSTDTQAFLKYKPWLKFMGRLILKNASQIICISPQIKRQLELKFGDKYLNKLVVIPNGIDSSYVNAEEVKPSGTLTNTTKLLFIGEAIKRKRLLQLLNFVSERKHKFELCVVGDGVDMPRYRQLMEGVKNITFCGKITDKAILRKIFQDADIFVMVSKNETFGLVYIEAMSQGTPVIYSKGTGIDGLFKDGEVGFGVSPEKDNELELAIERILADYDNISKRCMQKAKRFNWSSISQQYNDIYQDILHK